MKLFKFKSNPNTIVKELSSTLVQIVWNEVSGTLNNFIYSKVPDNLIELTIEEIEQVNKKIKAFDGVKLGRSAS